MKNKPIRDHIFIIFSFVSLSTYFLSLAVSSLYLNLFTLVILIIMLFYWLNRFYDLWIFLYLVFGFILASFVSVLIEYIPVYLSEVRIYSFFSGSAARNISLMTLFLSTSINTYYKFSGLKNSIMRPVKYIDQFAIRLIMAVAILILIYIYIIVLIYGSPLTMKIDRFMYMNYVAPSEFRNIFSLLTIMGFPIAYAASTNRLKATYSNLWFILAVIVLILGGEKFSGIFLLALSFFTPYFILGKLKLNIMKFVAFSTVFFGIMTMLIMFSYHNLYGGSYFEVFITRLGLQAQMMFVIDTLVQSGNNGFNLLTKAFMGLGTSPDEKGIYYLMYLIAPESIVDSYYKNRVRFTMPFPANFSYFFGYYFSPILLLVFAILTGFAAVLVVKSIRNHNFILSFVTYKLLLKIYTLTVMGEMYRFFEWKFMLYILFLLLYFIISISTVKRSSSIISNIV